MKLMGISIKETRKPMNIADEWAALKSSCLTLPSTGNYGRELYLALFCTLTASLPSLNLVTLIIKAKVEKSAYVCHSPMDCLTYSHLLARNNVMALPT